jgi:hypothetical protein
MTPRYLSASDIAAILKISKAAAYREIHRMPHVIVGEKILPVRDLLQVGVSGIVAQAVPAPI